MSRMEDDLKSALSRRDAPADFADRVMSRLPAQSGQSRRSHSWLAAAAAALIAVLGMGTYEYQRAEQVREDGEKARAELVFALEVASEKLNYTRAKVLRHSEAGI